MARNYILGGSAATQLQAGKPFFKRIVRLSGDGTAGARADGLTCIVDADGAISFDVSNAETDGHAKNWNANADGKGGELLMVEFPTTVRSVQILLEEAWSAGTLEDPGDGVIRAKVMLSAEGQDVAFDKTTPVLATPVASGNFIEIKTGETATISSRTKAVFILIQKFANNNVITDGTSTTVGAAGDSADAVSLLITGVLDHEPAQGSQYASNEPNSRIIDGQGNARELRQIWGKGDGVG
mgnify:CR=1 FL=1